jgi:hypothetical protein
VCRWKRISVARILSCNAKECIYQGDKTESKSQEIQPHESEAAYTPKTLEEVFQTHQAEVDKRRHTKQE